MRGRRPRRSFGPSARTVTYVAPPKFTSFPIEREQIEYSSRSIVFRADGDGILRVWGPPEQPWVIGVTPQRSRWCVRAWGASPPEARRAARALFSFDHPLEQFYRLARSDPLLRPAVRSFHGLRLPRDAHLFESLVHAVIGQQLSVRAANTLKERLFQSTDAWVEVEGSEVPHIPTPARLHELGVPGLRAVGLSRVKSSALIQLACQENRDGFRSMQWEQVGLEDAVAFLDALPGVGRWTAENALLRGVGRPDVFVAGDLAVVLALDEYGVLPRTAPEKRRRAWGEAHYPGWGSYLTLYLWRRWVADHAARTTG
jgi:DNA-3-methyladenine glycosylase II